MNTGSAVAKAATRSPVTNFISAREVARVKGVSCNSVSCVDDLMFVTTWETWKNFQIIKYRWEEYGGKVSINEVKRSATIEGGFYLSTLAAAKTQDRVRLYVYNHGKKRVDRFDPESLKHLITLNTDTLPGRSWWPSAILGILHDNYWHIAAWDEVLVIADRRIIYMYKDDQLVSTVQYKQYIMDIRLSSTFLAIWNGYGRWGGSALALWHGFSTVQVMRWGGDRLDTTPVYTIGYPCVGLAMSERLLVTTDRHDRELVTLDLGTGEQRQLNGGYGCWRPDCFLLEALAREDLVAGIDGFRDDGEKDKINRGGPGELIMMQLS